MFQRDQEIGIQKSTFLARYFLLQRSKKFHPGKRLNSTQK